MYQFVDDSWIVCLNIIWNYYVHFLAEQLCGNYQKYLRFLAFQHTPRKVCSIWWKRLQNIWVFWCSNTHWTWKFSEILLKNSLVKNGWNKLLHVKYIIIFPVITTLDYTKLLYFVIVDLVRWHNFILKRLVLVGDK